jgi:hypothetical protein
MIVARWDVKSVERIEELIVAASDGYFDDEGIRSDLHVTIRIANDFYDFLVKFGDSPEAYDIDYMMGTIRSGIDEFFLLAYICRSLFDEGFWTGAIDQQVHWKAAELRIEFMRRFEHLEDPDLKVVDRLASLFVLAHLELVFLAQNFPSAEFAESPRASMSEDELKRELFEMISDSRDLQAGRISLEESDARAEARRKKRKP